MKPFRQIFNTWPLRLAAIFLLVGPLIVAAGTSWSYWELVSSGVDTTGSFVAVEKGPTSRGRWLIGPHELSYEFADARGHLHRDWQRVDRETFDRWGERPPGSPIEVRYNPSRPSNSVVSLPLLRSTLICWWLLAAAVWGPVALAMMLMARRATPPQAT